MEAPVQARLVSDLANAALEHLESQSKSASGSVSQLIMVRKLYRFAQYLDPETMITLSADEHHWLTEGIPDAPTRPTQQVRRKKSKVSK